MNYGKTQWFIPDGYMAGTASGAYVSHEAICVLNMTDREARLGITVYFEDEAPLTGLTACCRRNAQIMSGWIKSIRQTGRAFRAISHMRGTFSPPAQ